MTADLKKYIYIGYINGRLQIKVHTDEWKKADEKAAIKLVIRLNGEWILLGLTQ